MTLTPAGAARRANACRAVAALLETWGAAHATERAAQVLDAVDAAGWHLPRDLTRRSRPMSDAKPRCWDDEPGCNCGGYEPPPPLADRIKADIRGGLTQRGKTQADMARDLGLSQKHVSQVLTGRVDGSLDLLDRMLRYAQDDTLPSCEVMATWRRALAVTEEKARPASEKARAEARAVVAAALGRTKETT